MHASANQRCYQYYRPTFIWKRVSKSIHQGREYQYKFRHAQNVHLLLAFQLSLSSSIRSTLHTSQFQSLRLTKSSSVYASKFAIYFMVYEKTKLLFPFCFSYIPANKWSMDIEYVDQAQGFHQVLKLFTGNYHQSSTNSEFGGLGLYKFVLLCKCEEKGSQ